MMHEDLYRGVTRHCHVSAIPSFTLSGLSQIPFPKKRKSDQHKRKLIIGDLMMMRSLFVQRPLHLMARQNAVSVLKYSTGDRVSDMAEKARSTAEEFIRQAKEKKDKMSETVKENFDEAKEAATGESEEQKEKFKEKVEKGNYDNMGRP